MRPTSWFLVQVSVCSVLLSSPTTAISGNTSTHSKFVGAYVSQSLDGAKAGPSMDLSLGPDGTATVTEDPGNGTTTLFGHWVESGSQVMVTFDAVDGKTTEPPMFFRPGHDGLQAATWNHAT